MKRRNFLFPVFFCLLGCCEKLPAPNRLLIRNVHVISMASEDIAYNQSILIEDQLIRKIGHSNTVKPPRDAQVIEGKGCFILPGLADMHMHIDHPDVLKLNLAYGITTVMNYRGLEEHLMLRSQSSRNEIFSPHIYTTGDYMEGYPATFPGFLSFENPEEAMKAVKQQKKRGYDFIKVYRNLDTAMHQAICDAARENDLTVVGHLSPSISMEQSFTAGQKVVAHTEELMYFFANENKLDKIDSLIHLFKEYDVVYTPNLGIFKSLIDQVENIDSINALPHLQYLHPTLRQSWRKKHNYNFRRGRSWATFMRERFVFLKEVTRRMHAAGVPILTSTDAPTAGAFPGLAVHQELEQLVNIGLRPFEALQTATVLPGRFIDRFAGDHRPSFGLVQEDYRADLLLLEKNPLENISYTKSLAGVIKNGQWYSTEHLEKVLDKLADKNKRIAPIILEIDSLIEQEAIVKAQAIYAKAKKQMADEVLLGYYTMWFVGYRFLYEGRQLTRDTARAAKAVKFYEMYAKDYPTMHGSYFILGMAHKANRDTTAAIENFRQSLEFHPANPYAQRQLKMLQADIR